MKQLEFIFIYRMSVMRAEGSSETHSTVFFTFQFYKFPHITTERLLLGEPEQQLTADRSAQPCILRRLAPDGKMKQGPAGYQVCVHFVTLVEYRCIYTYIRTYVHTYLHTYILTYIHTYIHPYIHPYI